MTSQDTPPGPPPATFIVEHLDPELGPWSALEYASIATESRASNTRFMLTSVPETLQLPENLKALVEGEGQGEGAKAMQVENRSVEEIFAHKKDKVCLLDPSAEVELRPEDGRVFEVFLFGGILGTTIFYLSIYLR